MTAAAALLLAERGAVSLNGPVTKWWPEFGAYGKADATGEHLLTHQTGLPAFDRPITPEQAADPAAMAAQLAAQPPEWEPGTAHGYHAITFGWLVGEVVRRHAGVGVGDFVRAEIGADLWIGVPSSMLDGPEGTGGVARIAAGKPATLEADELPATPDAVAALVAASADPQSMLLRATMNPAASFNNPTLLTAGWPAAGLVCTARSLAAFYARLTAGAMTPETMRDAVRERVRGPDRTLVLDSAFGLGFMRPAANMYLPEVARAGAFGHPGASGALGIGDLDAGVAFAYVPNLSRPALGDRRAHHLVRAVYDSL